MSDSVVAALIGFASAIVVAVLSLIGVLYTAHRSRKENDSRMNEFQSDMIASVKASTEIAQAVTDVKIEELTEEVRKHNNFAERIPTIEADLKNAKEDIKELKDKVNRL